MIQIVQPTPNIIDPSSPTKEYPVTKQKKGKEKIIEKTNIEVVEEDFKLENNEIAVLKKEARKHNV